MPDATTATESSATATTIPPNEAPVTPQAAAAQASAEPAAATTDEPSLMGAAGADKPAEAGDDSKPEGDKKDEPEGPPETYELAAPEGMEITPEIKAEVEPVFKELGLTNEQANKLMPLAGTFAERIVKQQSDQFLATASDWAKEAKADPEIGGRNWQQTEGHVAKALDHFIGPAKDAEGKPHPFRQLLDESKLGNHPEMIRAFAKIGAALGEDSNFVRPDTGAPVKKSREEVLYGTTE